MSALTNTHLMLLPGLDGTALLFRPFLDAIPAGVVTATPVAYPRNLATYDELEPVIRDKLVENTVIVAESFSGPLGVRMARDQRVRALILCNSFVSPPRPSWLRHFVTDPLFSIRAPRWLIRWCLLGTGAQPALVEEVRHAIKQVPPSVLTRRLRQVLKCDERAALPQLAGPVLLLSGTNDILVGPRSTAEIKAIVPSAHIEKIAGPHLLLQVQPRPCWDAMLAFLADSGLP